MKLSVVTLQVFVDAIDTEEVENSLKEWYMNHEIGMEWHNIHSATFETDDFPSDIPLLYQKED